LSVLERERTEMRHLLALLMTMLILAATGCGGGQSPSNTARPTAGPEGGSGGIRAGGIPAKPPQLPKD